VTWKIRNPWGEGHDISDDVIPDERDGKDGYTLQELHNAVWSPSGEEINGEWFRLADGRKALLMSIDLDFIDDGSMMLKTEEEL
jgi:hypothetical protein